MNGTLVEHDNEYHNRRSYKICVTKAGNIITRTANHTKQTPIFTEQYLCNEMAKAMHKFKHIGYSERLCDTHILVYSNASNRDHA